MGRARGTDCIFENTPRYWDWSKCKQALGTLVLDRLVEHASRSPDRHFFGRSGWGVAQGGIPVLEDGSLDPRAMR
jgi:hypothetical protein